MKSEEQTLSNSIESSLFIFLSSEAETSPKLKNKIEMMTINVKILFELNINLTP